MVLQYKFIFPFAFVILFVNIQIALTYLSSTQQYTSLYIKHKYESIHRVHQSLKADTNNQEEMVFGGVKFHKPISTSLKQMGITLPTPIQKASIAALTTGMSAILHAETGSGKTLAYILPLLKRLILSNPDILKSGSQQSPGIKAMIIVPSKELAVQIAADIASLLGDETWSQQDEIKNLIHLCISTNRHGFDSVTSPIVIGIPIKIMDAMRSSSSNTFKSLQYIVLDEVDRLLSVTGRYATTNDIRQANENTSPTEVILTNLIRLFSTPTPSPPSPSTSKTLSAERKKNIFQIVAVSATVGRPLKRELSRIVSQGKSYDEGFIIIRSDEDMKRKESLNQRVTRKQIHDIDNENDTNNDNNSNNNSNNDNIHVNDGDENKVSISRVVGIPTSITHKCILVDCETNELNKKLANIRDTWVTSTNIHRGILFVPTLDDVKQTLGMFHFWGIKEAMDLPTALGLSHLKPTTPSSTSSKTKTTSKSISSKKNTSIKSTSKHNNNSHNGNSNIEEDDEERREKSTSWDFIQMAQMNRLGASAKLNTKNTDSTTNEDDSNNDYNDNNDGNNSNNISKKRELYIAPVSGTRGLHLQNIESVYITLAPRTMDEYLHMAGRTGRAGNTHNGGAVISYLNYDELKRLQSWQVPLGIQLDIAFDT